MPRKDASPAAGNGLTAVAMLPVTSIAPGGTNPRRHFDEGQLLELADSIRAHGVLQPVLVRAKGRGYELVCGERRWRASTLAGRTEIPAIVRELKDEEVLEIQLVENLARADLHPLEEAQGYEQLHTRHGYSVETIAAKLGRSRKYVYDRIKLLALTEDAKKHFLAGRLTAGHAILLARLDEKAQEEALASRSVLRDEQLLFSPDGDAGPEDEGLVACSVRELEAWIDRHVRFDVEEVDQMVFPETAEAIEAATAEEATVLQITHEFALPPSLKGSAKTLTSRSWKRADGKRKSKTCEHAKPACIVIGYGRGEAFAVCTAKDKCKVHWASEQRERARRAKERGKAPPGSDAAARAQADAKNEAARRKAEEDRKRRAKAAPAIRAACLAAAGQASPELAVTIIENYLREQAYIRDGDRKEARKALPAKPSAEDLLHYLARLCFPLVWEDYGYVSKEEAAILKALGIDLAKLLDEHAPEPKEEKPAKAAKKKAARK